MKTILICLTTICVFASCSKDNDDTTSSQGFDGAYSGTFSRTGMDAADIRLDMFSGKYTGYSMQFRYPAICGGSFVKNENTIVFNDTCDWTPGYDPALTGTFNINLESDGRWRIWRTDDGLTDEYLLRRITR